MASLTAIGTVAVDVDAQSAMRGGLVALVTGDAVNPVFSFDVTADGSTWVAVPAIKLASGAGTLVTGGTATGTYLFNTGGMTRARVNLTAIDSGTLTVTFSPGDGDSISYLATGVTVTPSGTQTVAGAAADDAAASGNPVPVGGKYNASLPTYTDGDRTQLQTDVGGRVLVQATGAGAAAATATGNPILTGGVVDNSKPSRTNGHAAYFNFGARNSLQVEVFGADSQVGAAAAAYSSDAQTASSANGIFTKSHVAAFNGSTIDRWRNNNDITVLASAARTATVQSSDITNYNGRGLHLVINVTAASATPSVVFTIQGKDALSSAYYTILASAAITGTGTTVLRVFPGATAAANLAANDILPRTWRVDATHADADSITYSIGASVIL